jgi:hypothetical protein
MSISVDFSRLFEKPPTPTRRRIFVSYQHSSDQAYYDEFSRIFHDTYEAIFDNSLERRVDSEAPNYVIQRIRDNHISRTSCTIVFCGSTSYQRKYIDWEVKATLDKLHGLIAIQLPTLPVVNGQVRLPTRVNQNINSGYALWKHWNYLAIQTLNQWIEEACVKPAMLIVNPGEIKQRNG